MRLRGAIIAALMLAAPVFARDPLGVFDGWGAFRDVAPLRCFAIAEPVQGGGSKWRPFATISNWPEKNVRGQFHVRLSRERRENAVVMLVVDDRRWKLAAGRVDAWGPSAAHDAFIITKIRSGRSMSISSVSANGSAFADTYRLKGAATAIDAAALGCSKAQ